MGASGCGRMHAHCVRTYVFEIHTRIDGQCPGVSAVLSDRTQCLLPQSGLRWLESSFADKARAWVGFNEPVSHRITAAADILLMPSRFEPCGLNQLYAMRCAPVLGEGPLPDFEARQGLDAMQSSAAQIVQ